MELIDRIHAVAAQEPTRIAYRDARDGDALTYASLRDAIARVAAPPAGTTAIVVSPNRIELPATILGLLASGVHVFPLLGTTTRHELAALARRVDAAAVFGDAVPAGSEPLPPVVSLAASRDQTSRDGKADLLLATSGSTGVPKIIRRSTASLDAVSANMVEAIGFTSADHVLAAVPLAHSYGIEHGLLAPLWAGATVTLCDGLDLPAIVGALARGDVTIFPTVPAVIERLADTHVYGLSGVRTIYSAGGPLPDAVRDRSVARYGVPIGQLYGATEIGTVCYRPGNAGTGVGRAMRGVSIRSIALDDPTKVAAPGVAGEIAVRAPSMMTGYHDGEPAPLIEGHFLTGDLGYVDAGGSLVLTGRSKLLIDTGGPKVDPLEVERVIESHPAVATCVVVPLRQSETVCRLRAVVVLRSAVTADELRAFARLRLAPHKVPRVVEFRTELPRSAAGKVVRHLLENS